MALGLGRRLSDGTGRNYERGMAGEEEKGVSFDHYR